VEGGPWTGDRGPGTVDRGRWTVDRGNVRRWEGGLEDRGPWDRGSGDCGTVDRGTADLGTVGTWAGRMESRGGSGSSGNTMASAANPIRGWVGVRLQPFADLRHLNQCKE
jgi:hypothetical protein